MEPGSVDRSNHPGLLAGALGGSDHITWDQIGPVTPEGCWTGPSAPNIQSVNGLKATVTATGAGVGPGGGPACVTSTQEAPDGPWDGNFDASEYLAELNTSGQASLTISFANPVMGFGTQWDWDGQGSHNGTIVFTDAGGTKIGSFAFSGSITDPTAVFIGAVSTTPIGSVTISSDYAFAIDRVDLKTGCPVNACGSTSAAPTVGCVSVLTGDDDTAIAAMFRATTTLSSAETSCNFSGFNFKSQVVADPTPPNSAITGLPLLPPYWDPPLGGYQGQPQTANQYPFYYNAGDFLDSYELNGFLFPILTSSVLTFRDAPSDPFLFSSQFLGYVTTLVGIKPDNSTEDLYQFSWQSTYNGTIGGVSYQARSNFSGVPDPGSGTGGVTITSVNGVALPPPLTSGNECDGSYSGTFRGNIVISKGQSCVLEYGTVAGNVRQNGGSLTLLGESVSGDLGIWGASTFSLGPGTTINGSIAIALIASVSATNQVCGTTVLGDVAIVGNATPLVIGSGSSTSCPGNIIHGNATIDFNTATMAVYNNSVNKSLSCLFNTAITGAGNTAKKKLGQCAAF